MSGLTNEQRLDIETALRWIQPACPAHRILTDMLARYPVSSAAPAEGREAVDERAAWEYSFIHSSATGRGDSKIGPCLTYERSIAFGVGCIDQREMSVSPCAALATAPTMSEGAGEPASARYVGELVCGDIEDCIGGPEVGDYEIIQDKTLDEINASNPGKVFDLYAVPEGKTFQHPASEPITDAARDFEADAKRLALELECLLLSCKDMAAVTKWFDSAMEALEQHRALIAEIERIDRAGAKGGSGDGGR